MPEMTPEEMRARIVELEGRLENAQKDLRLAHWFDEGDLTPEEIHDMLHGPRAEPGAFEKVIRDLCGELEIES